MCLARRVIPLAAALFAASAIYGQESKATLERKLEDRYSITHATGDNKQILTAGVVLVLKKDHLSMVSISTPNLVPNVYKDGKISQKGVGGLMSRMPGYNKRVFMTTEKMWVTQIEIKDDGVVFDLLSDPIDDVRYKGVLRFPFAKGTVPTFNEVNGEIAEVFNTEHLPATEASSTPQQKAQATGPVAPPPPPPPPVPAPTADEGQTTTTKSVAPGQTPDQVVAILGQPQKILKPSSIKQIYVYPDIKVIFVNNKVSDMQ